MAAVTTAPRTVPAQTLPSRRAFVEQVMGMPISIHLKGYGLDEPRVLAAVADAMDALRHFDSVFSTWQEGSDISRLARGELRLEECDPLVAEALDIALDAAELTGGAFTSFLPSGQGDLRFDPTGLVKGWAVDVAGEALAALAEQAGVSFCINAGGDVLVGGSQAFGPWRVGVENPDDRTRVATVVTVTDGAVATSGCAARGGHLFDPRTGEQVLRRGSATVTGPTLLWADIWATAVFVGGEDTAERLATCDARYETFSL